MSLVLSFPACPPFSSNCSLQTQRNFLEVSSLMISLNIVFPVIHGQMVSKKTLPDFSSFKILSEFQLSYSKYCQGPKKKVLKIFEHESLPRDKRQGRGLTKGSRVLVLQKIKMQEQLTVSFVDELVLQLLSYFLTLFLYYSPLFLQVIYVSHFVLLHLWSLNYDNGRALAGELKKSVSIYGRFCY